MAVMLTKREEEILKLLCEGKENREISRKIYLSESRVKLYVHRIFKKLGVKHRSAAAARGVKRGYGDIALYDFGRLESTQFKAAELAAEDKTNKEISLVLGISARLVGNEITKACKKLGIRNRELLAAAVTKYKLSK